MCKVTGRDRLFLGSMAAVAWGKAVMTLGPEAGCAPLCAISI